jgi:hypothetical protein
VEGVAVEARVDDFLSSIVSEDAAAEARADSAPVREGGGCIGRCWASGGSCCSTRGP